MHTPRIRILATGGTIAGAADSAAEAIEYQAGALSVDTLCKSVPALADIAHITTEQVAAIDSKDADPAFWKTLALRAQQALDADDVDGLVITHGTDTLEETAYYLHLVLKSDKPVVLVGAMRPATSLSADGPMNLLDAVRVAGASGAEGRGVLVAVNHQIFGAREIAKTNTMRTDSFSAPEAGAFGLVRAEQVVWLARSERGHTWDTEFDVNTPLAQVEILMGYAGASPLLVQAVADAGARGLIWAGVGDGSMAEPVRQAVERALQAGLVVVRASRTGSGYVSGRANLARSQANPDLAAGTLAPPKARVLLMLALGAGFDQGAIRAAFARY